MQKDPDAGSPCRASTRFLVFGWVPAEFNQSLSSDTHSLIFLESPEGGELGKTEICKAWKGTGLVTVSSQTRDAH